MTTYRRDSKVSVDNLKLNRLSKWSVAATQGVLVSFTPSQIAAVPTSRQIYAGRLELDINTAPDFAGELDRGKLSQLFNELMELGTEIAEKGDVS